MNKKPNASDDIVAQFRAQTGREITRLTRPHHRVLTGVATKIYLAPTRRGVYIHFQSHDSAEKEVLGRNDKEQKAKPRLYKIFASRALIIDLAEGELATIEVDPIPSEMVGRNKPTHRLLSLRVHPTPNKEESFYHREELKNPRSQVQRNIFYNLLR